MKKAVSLMMAAAMTMGLAACGATASTDTAASAADAASTTEAAESTADSAAAADGKVYNVGICQLVQHEALDAAKQRSGLTNEAIANRSSLSTAAVSRYFNKYDDYTPSPELIPLLCRALGNTIIADWIAAQVEDMHPATNITTTEDLTRAVMQATENTGILNKKTLDAVADGELSPSEAATIQAQFRANAKWNNEAADALDPLAGGQVYRHGYGFVAVPVLDGSPR